MDMIGDREACREPKKVPFFIFIEDKNKTEQKMESCGSCKRQCKTIDQNQTRRGL